MSPLVRVIGTVLAWTLAAALGGCTVKESQPSSAPPAAASTRTPAGPGAEPPAYTALGDSFTAAPFVPVTDLAAGCLRSTGNYPALVAAALGTEVADASCSGARTRDVRRPQSVAQGQGTVPPQVRAVSRDDDLVTIGLGGNDENLFATLVGVCTTRSDDCASALARPGVVQRTSRRVAGVVGLVRRRAPEATVVVVGYPRLVAPDRPCPLIPIAKDDLAAVAALEAQLDAGLARAARRSGAVFVGLAALSRGHEICSTDPWVNGRVTDSSAALAYHPFAVEQEAVADAVLAVVRPLVQDRP